MTKSFVGPVLYSILFIFCIFLAIDLLLLGLKSGLPQARWRPIIVSRSLLPLMLLYPVLE